MSKLRNEVKLDASQDASSLLFVYLLRPALFPAEGEKVGDHGDELRIGGFAFDVGHGVAEEFLQGLQVAAVPGYFDGVGCLSAPRGDGWRTNCRKRFIAQLIGSYTFCL